MSASNPSMLLDKLNGRRSTPDSEALASSDDEGDNQQRQEHTIPTAAPHKPVRRASWLNDTTQPLSLPRKGSFASSTMSPTTSHPTTPSTETGTWGAHTSTSSTTATGRVPPGSTSFPWGSGIWNTDARKDAPHRLSEVLPSPTSLTGGFANNGLFNTDNGNSQSLAASRDAPAETTIPFAIPLHPTPKTYRSQSYSVGQLDAESNVPGAGILPGPGFNGRGRGMHHSGLQHRPSRPSMLSEVSSDGTGLGKLKEVDDDDLEEFDNMAHGSQLQDQAKVLEALARENAMLRKQNYHNSRLRPRAATSTSLAPFQPGYTYGLQDTLPEESDYAIDEMDEMGELQDIGNKSMLARRLSEYSEGQLGRGGYGAAENRKLENVKKAIWQSSLGFGGLSDISQSRRHSFADVPTRHASVGSAGEQMAGRENGHQEQILPQDVQSRYADSTDYTINDHGKLASSTTAHPFLPPGVNYSRGGNTAVSYFGGAPVQARNTEAYGLPPYQQASAYQAYPTAPAYGSVQPTSPHRNIYSVPQPRQNQLLYIVLFKCSRADVFYVQEGTGLSVKPGDLVIVEADRGTDLGTVAQDNVDWATAKELKEHYAEEHYKWLMMYSQGAVGTADGTGAGLMAASNGLQGSAVGGMGPPTQHGMQEPNPGELKPKIIKRLAQNHEIQALRDKEGNEAKAKRVCMQKVKEHGLHMEILDAEFQMDWKKLTFYYFADAYINFNSLVTDLFKVYKTRIWMSAINPASFASPSLGLQAPSGVGPGAVGANRQTQVERRPQQPPQQEQPSFNALNQGARGYKPGAANAFQPTLDKPSVSPTSFQQPFTYGHSAFTPAARNGPGNYGPNMMQQQMESFSQFPTAADYHGVPDRFLPSHTTGNGQDPGDFSRPVGDNEGWMNSFQGLSLNSR
ncbi:hypothetical protein VF21_06783 [Pseudogymnoascus sp. 05NY08]|nr:hypothetical protein VF21_06783 [Pseudogymnoascus sp. 05NY08]